MKRRYILLILFCLLYIAPVMGFEDDFNDGDILDWTIVGTWGTKSGGGWDDSKYLYSTYSGGPSLWWMSHETDMYAPVQWSFDYYTDKGSTNSNGMYKYIFVMEGSEYSTLPIVAATPNDHYQGDEIIGFCFDIYAGKVYGIGFEYDKSYTDKTWYHFNIIKSGNNIRTRRYDTSGNLIDDITNNLLFTVSNPDRIFIETTNYGHVQEVRVDNVKVYDDTPGYGFFTSVPSNLPVNVLAMISYKLMEYDHDLMDYYVYIYSPSGGLYTSEITSGNEVGTIEYPTIGRISGTYSVYLIGKSDTTSIEYILDLKEMVLESTVEAYGQTIDAVTWNNIPGVNVTYFQSSYWHNDTSDASGFYNVSNMSVGYLIDINASKTNYTHEVFNVTPTFSYNNSVDLYLFPTNRTLAGTSIVEGVTVSYPWHQGIGGATVNLYNDTWSNITTSNANGYYQFNLSELVNGTYTVNATLSGYDNSSEYTITVTKNQSTVQNIVLNKKYVLTVTATDATTSSPLSTFSTTVDGTLINTDNGTTTHYLDYGQYLVTAGAEGYMASSEYALMIMDRSIEFSLSRESSQDEYHLDYTHYTKFILTSLNGTRYSGVDVTVSDGQTGITDDEGGVGFEMSQNTSYTLEFVNASQGIDISRTLYPVESLYYVYLEESVGFSTGNVSANLTDFNITYFNDSFSLQNITGSYLTSTMGFNAMSQGIIAGFVIWIVIGAGGPFTAVAAGVVMAINGILSWVVVLFITMTIIAIWILEGHIG